MLPFDFGFTGYLLIFGMILFLGPFALFNNMIHELGWGFGPFVDIALLEDVYLYPLLIGLICFATCVGAIARMKNRSVFPWCFFACIFPPCLLVLIFLSKLQVDKPLKNTPCVESTLDDTKAYKHDNLDV